MPSTHPSNSRFKKKKHALICWSKSALGIKYSVSAEVQQIDIPIVIWSGELPAFSIRTNSTCRSSTPALNLSRAFLSEVPRAYLMGYMLESMGTNTPVTMPSTTIVQWSLTPTDTPRYKYKATCAPCVKM